MTALQRQSPQGYLANAYLSWKDDGGSQSLVFDLVESEEWTGGSIITDRPVEVGVDTTDNIRVSLRRVTLKIFATNEPIEESNPWSNGSMALTPLTMPTRAFTPSNPVLDVPEWENNLMLRVLANAAGGAIGNAAGGAVGGAIGAVAGSLLGDALFAGKIVHESVRTNASGIAPTPTPATIAALALSFDTNDDYVQRTIELIERLRVTSQTIDVLGTKMTCEGKGDVGGMAIETFTHVRGQEEGSGASLTLVLKEIRIVTTTTVPAPKPSVPRAKTPVKKGNQEGEILSDAAKKIAAKAVAGEHLGETDVAKAGAL